MVTQRRSLAALLLVCCLASSAWAEIVVRWDREQMPSPESLGISTLVVPAYSPAVQNALRQGYRLYLEVEASRVARFYPPSRDLAGVLVKGKASPADLDQLRLRLGSPSIRVITLEERGKWPHIRTNWITKNNEVLQVTGRSAQPWIESNAALLRIVRAARPDSTPLLTYAWTPITLSDKDEGPRLEDYLVAIAEAGSFGGDLLLPLHERFQRRLFLGQPDARAEWSEIRRYIEFFSWSLPTRYRPIANIGVITAEPMRWFEVMNLLARHNLPFEIIPSNEMSKHLPGPFKLLIVLDTLQGAQLPVLAEFERNGGKVTRVQETIADPNAFALQVRQTLGREHRVIDIWNGITVLTAPYQEPNGSAVLVTALNYAHQPLPVQLRIRGTFSSVQYESPEEPPALLSYQHRDGYTEFVLPALRVGARVFLRGATP